MPRTSKTKLAEATQSAPDIKLTQPEIPEQPVPFEPIELPLGNRTFTIAPMASRGGAESYDDAADFTVAAIPLVTRMKKICLPTLFIP